MLGWWSGAGFWGLRGGAAGFWARVRWRFVRICPDFRVFGGDGLLEGLDGVSPLAPLLGLADGFGGWLGLLASFFAVLLFFKKVSKK